MGTKWGVVAVEALRQAVLDQNPENLQKATNAVVCTGDHGSTYSFLVEMNRMRSLSFYGDMAKLIGAYPVFVGLDYALNKDMKRLSGVAPFSDGKQFVQLVLLHKLLQKSDFVPQDIRIRYMDRIESALKEVPNLLRIAMRSRQENSEFAAIRMKAKSKILV